MKETVSVAQAATAQEEVLPVRPQEALGELVGSAKEGLLALSVGVGLGVLCELMEEEACEVVGPKGNGVPRFERHLIAGERFASLAHPRERSLAFERFHNEHHR